MTFDKKIENNFYFHNLYSLKSIDVVVGTILTIEFKNIVILLMTTDRSS